MSSRGEGSGAERRVLLGMVEAFKKNYRGARMRIGSGGYGGECTYRGSKLIADTSEAHKESRAPQAAMVIESETHPGDMALVPTHDRSPDNLEFVWTEGGKIVTVDMLKVLTYKKIAIPEGTNLIIDLYADTDSTYGPVVGMKLVGAPFEAKKKGTPRKKNPTPPPPDPNANAKGEGTQAQPKPEATE